MSVYKIVELVGTSPTSWEDAATEAITTAKETLRDLRVAEVVQQDIDLSGGQIVFRTKRLIRVRSVRCLRSSFWVKRLPTSCSAGSRWRR